MRYLLLIIGIIAAIAILKHLYGKPRKPLSKSEKKTQTMVRCEHCKVHIPRDEAVHANDHYYCSDEHYRLSQH